MSTTQDILLNIKQAQHTLRHLDAKTKNHVLDKLIVHLEENKNEIIKANKIDISNLDSSTTSAFKDRLTLNDTRFDSMVNSIEEIIKQNDPIGEIFETKKLDNGLQLKKVRAPLGIIFIIFESRPNVVIDSFALAFKSGNSCILRGGKESINTCKALYDCIENALTENGLSPFVCYGIKDSDRTLVTELLKHNKYIDVVIPRGGDQLIEFVTSNTKIPVIKNDRGMCHVYVDENADLNMALDIVVNAKTQRPGVCNAMETLIVHSKVAGDFIPKLISKFKAIHDVEIYGCEESIKFSSVIKSAVANSFDTEYLDYKMNCKIVHSLEDAILHIESHGSKHSEAIITSSAENAKRFQNEIDAAVVYWNASTRFTDGFEFDLGGEIGISTQKLHVRGPVGLKELTSLRWIANGTGQIRK